MLSPAQSEILHPATDAKDAWQRLIENAKNDAVSITDMIREAEALKLNNDFERSKLLFETWLKHSSSPHKFVAWFNFGVILFAQGDKAYAKKAYESALQIKPDFFQAKINLGTTLEAEGDVDAALAIWEKIVADPVSVSTPEFLILSLNNIGRVREIRREYSAAEDALKKSLALNPKQQDVIHHLVHLRQKQCKWPVLDELPGVSQNQMLRSMSPLAMLAHTDDPGLQLLAAENFINRKLKCTEDHLCKGRKYQHTRLRIGYMSADLCAHAVGLLMPEIFEHHDKARFEIFVYDYGREVGPKIRQRFKNAIEHFRPISSLSDKQVADLVLADEIDILIDMHGLSAGTRPGVLALRPAPIQATYLGYIGTTAMPWIDYVIADPFSLPESLLPYFSEKPLYLETSFLPGDTQRDIGKAVTRAEVGLPEDAFVFASFNNTYKLNQEMFACWMQILGEVENSVLWTVDDNPWATDNLKQEAKKLGIDPARLIFSPRVPPEDFLARIPLADLFLDNYPYNAGSTANDVLWMGLPMLTLSGNSFVSRMAGSLMTAAGCDELITYDFDSYIQKAISLSADAAQLQDLRQRLIARRAQHTPSTFVRVLEKGLNELMLSHSLNQAGIQQKTQYASLPAPRLLVNQHKVEKITPPQLFQIAYSDATLASVQTPFQALDNLKNDRPDWQEYWPIRRFLLNTELEENTFYGFFSPRFQEKTGLNGAQIQNFILNKGRAADVVTFSPQPDMGAFFLNVFEQNELFDPGFTKAAQDFVTHVGLGIDISKLIMDSRTTVFSNYFVAKPAFWRMWLDINEKLFALCENAAHASTVRDALVSPTNYKGGIQRKVFLMERIASLLLAANPQLNIVAYDTFKCAWSATTLGLLKSEAVLSDALKIAMGVNGHDEYIAEYSKIRAAIKAPAANKK